MGTAACTGAPNCIGSSAAAGTDTPSGGLVAAGAAFSAGSVLEPEHATRRKGQILRIELRCESVVKIPPLRLLLGSDAFKIAREADEAKISGDEAWKELTLSTDRDAEIATSR